MFSRPSAFNHLWAGAPAMGTLPLPLGPRRPPGESGGPELGEWGARPDSGAQRGTPPTHTHTRWLHCELAVQDVAEERVV